MSRSLLWINKLGAMTSVNRFLKAKIPPKICTKLTNETSAAMPIVVFSQNPKHVAALARAGCISFLNWDITDDESFPKFEKNFGEAQVT